METSSKERSRAWACSETSATSTELCRTLPGASLGWRLIHRRIVTRLRPILPLTHDHGASGGTRAQRKACTDRFRAASHRLQAHSLGILQVRAATVVRDGESNGNLIHAQTHNDLR